MAKAQKPTLGWWGERWLNYLDEEGLLQPMTPGEVRGAERGEARLTFVRGEVTVDVEVGDWGNQEVAILKLKPLGARDWRKVAAAIAQDPEAAHRLLAGSPGQELEALFAQAGTALFPPEHGRSLRCSCSSRWNCRHRRVLAVRAAHLFNANPFLWLQVLGMGREDLLAAVRAQMADQAGSQGHLPPSALAPLLDPDRFLATDTDPGSIPIRPGEARVPDALLRLLGPLPLSARLNQVSSIETVEFAYGDETYPFRERTNETAERVLARYYTDISQGASALALGRRNLHHREESLPGKAVSLADRLVVEIADAVDQAGSCLGLEALLKDCPTAAALPREGAVRVLGLAAGSMPDDYVPLGGRYVGRRHTLLTGALFYHVITWEEWLRGRFDYDADWVRALHLVSGGAPVQALVGDAILPVQPAPSSSAIWEPVFIKLKPQVGDEIEITVEDPARPLLRLSLRRRGERGLLDRLPADQTAARFLTQFAASTYHGMPETEAMETLLAEGFYRPGRSPDPVWLLTYKAVGESLRTGIGRTVTTGYWHDADGGSDEWNPYWSSASRARLTTAFVVDLLKQGASPKEAKGAEAMAWAWLRHWEGNPLEPSQPPTMTSFLHCLLTTAPLEAHRQRITAEVALLGLARWFRFLVASSPHMERVYRPYLAALEHVEPFRHRLNTLPTGKHGPMFDVWQMEGLRWLGPKSRS